MKTALIIHGRPDPGDEEYYNPNFPSPSNSHWIPWLQKQLQMHDISTQTPEMPSAWKPDYELWRNEFDRYDVDNETILVGHSCGSGFILRWLHEHPGVQVGTVALVAPSLGLDWEDASFFDRTVDPKITDQIEKLLIFVSDNDRPGIVQAAKVLQNTLPIAQVNTLPGYGHFCLEDMRTVEFPELRDQLLG